MFSSTARIAMLQARRFHKTALKPTFTNATASEMKEGRTRYHDTHDLIECKQSPTTPTRSRESEVDTIPRPCIMVLAIYMHSGLPVSQ